MTDRLRCFIQPQLTVNPRLLRMVGFILFDAIVIGELVLWNAYLAYVMFHGLQMNDFGKFYYSTVAYLRGGDMYGPSPATLQQLDGPHFRHFWNLNPPHFHILLLGLALLRPGFALAAWGILGLASFAYSWFLIIKETRINIKGPWRWRMTVVGSLLFAGTGATLATGQLSFLLLLIVTMCWLHARHGRWNRAAVFLGLAASLKPFLLIFVPYLALKRQFRAVFICALIVLACFGIGLLVFGFNTHLNWVRALGASSGWTWPCMNASALGFLSRVMDASPHFTPMVIASHLVRPLWFVSAGIVLILTMAATATNPGTFSVDRDFALLLVAALLISPLGWVYYLWLPIGPLIALVASSWQVKSWDWTEYKFSRLRWRNGLFLGSMLALVVPFTVVDHSESSGWSTALLGSVYFWGTLTLWSGLLLDWSTQIDFRNGLSWARGVRAGIPTDKDALSGDPVARCCRTTPVGIPERYRVMIGRPEG